jgi:formylglycine-generating enzyme required for sulfatase activity/uncharacterized caspase-like protein
MYRAALLFFSAVVVLAAATTAEAKRVALVVGINTYDNLTVNQQLKKARNDARSVAATFKDIGFQVILAEDTGRTAFLRAWQRFLDTVAPGDVTALFFSGHGVEINGSNYLLVRDIPEAADGEEVLKNSGVRLQALMERLKEQKPQVSIFVIDACRDSPYANQAGKRGLVAARGLRPEDPPKGTLIMMSAGAGQEALDSLSLTDPDPNSVYTRTLLPLLKEPGLEITDLAKRLRGTVEALAATVRHEQRPAFYHELSGDFFLVPRAETAPLAVTANAAPANEASVAWATTKDTTSPAVLDAFIRQFSGTVYANMARARLDELKRAQGPAAVAAAPPPKPAPPGAAPASGPLATGTKPPSNAAPAAPSAYETAQEWAKTRETTSPAVLEAFIARFGDSIYGPMARDRLRALSNAQVAAVVPPAAPNVPSTTVPAVAPPARMPAPPATTPAVGVFSTARPPGPLTAAEERALKAHDGFTECSGCPEMVVVPTGSYTMGSPATEEGRMSNEGPQAAVTLTKPFAVAKYAVTFAEWDACVAGGGCNGYRPSDDGRPRGRQPVVNVSWEDAEAYVAWLSKSTGKRYRLLSEAEREYVTRAGSTTPFWWGASISTEQANYDGTATYAGGKKGEYRQRSLPVDAFAPNPFGLHQVHGNVSEWVADCWRGSYQGASTDGTGGGSEDCGRRVLRGGSWYDSPNLLRAAARLGFYPAYRSNKIGFRVARSL